LVSVRSRRSDGCACSIVLTCFKAAAVAHILCENIFGVFFLHCS
jgi:hypothetical protein